MLTCFGCNQSTADGFVKNDFDVWYQYNDVVTEGRRVLRGDWVAVRMIVSDSAGHELYNYRLHSVDRMWLLHTMNSGGLVSKSLVGFSEGDSITLKLDQEQFINDTISSRMVEYSTSGAVKVSFRILKVGNKNEVEDFKEEALDLIELNELGRFHNVVDRLKQTDSVFFLDGVAVYGYERGKGGKLKYGENFCISYRLNLLEGKLLYESKDPECYVYGVQDQFIPGLGIALREQPIGTKMNLLIPGERSFSNHGFIKGILPSYSSIFATVSIDSALTM